MANSFLNTERPPVFCPGCAHERVVHALDKSFTQQGLKGADIAIVSDIGCSGLFDTFFNTHAFHGLHGRALTYATGIKMAQPHLKVVVTMGDGGLGIGGAHVLSTCRKNIDLTLLVLNNFNYGMTGGQCSSTTPADAVVGSGFLNRLEQPLDLGSTAAAAGAPFVERISAYQEGLSDKIAEAMRFEGFSILDIWGVCPGRYTKRNRLTPAAIQEALAMQPSLSAQLEGNKRKEYARHYREKAREQPVSAPPRVIEKMFTPPENPGNAVLILGKAGQRIVTAGEILGMAAMTAGLKAAQKNDYPITVLRGFSVSELIISEKKIVYAGIDSPTLVFALAAEGVARRKSIFGALNKEALVIRDTEVPVPPTDARILDVDFKAKKIKSQDRALGALAVIGHMNRGISAEMLKSALTLRFTGNILGHALELVDAFKQV